MKTVQDVQEVRNRYVLIYELVDVLKDDYSRSMSLATKKALSSSPHLLLRALAAREGRIG